MFKRPFLYLPQNNPKDRRNWQHVAVLCRSGSRVLYQGSGWFFCGVCSEAAKINCLGNKLRRLPGHSVNRGRHLPDTAKMSLHLGRGPRDPDLINWSRPSAVWCISSLWTSAESLASYEDHNFSWNNFHSLTEKTSLDPWSGEPIYLFSFLLSFFFLFSPSTSCLL